MGTKIMVVEDEMDIMRIITHALQSAGHQVIQAYGGEDAIRKLQTHRPDLVLTDLAMPGVSGVEVIQALKDNPDTRSIPVVAVTAFVWDGIAQAAGKAGCDGYISKPFTMKQLLQEVGKYLRAAGKT